MGHAPPKSRSPRDELVELLPLVSRKLHTSVMPKMHAAGLTNAQFWVLKWIDSQGPLTASHLAEFLGLRAPTVTSVVNDLESRALVQRTRSQRDRRVVSIQSTGRGRRLLSAALREVQRVSARALRDVPDREMESAVRVLRELARAIDSPSLVSAKAR